VAGVFTAWNALLVAQFYYVLPTGATPSWSDFLVNNQLRALAYIPRLFIQGTVVRDLATGDWAAAVGVWLALIAGLAAATWLTIGRRWRLRAKPLRPMPHAVNM